MEWICSYRIHRWRVEDLEGEDDLQSDLICPFCAYVIDNVRLCCHINEEHPVKAKNRMLQRFWVPFRKLRALVMMNFSAYLMYLLIR